MPAAGPPPPAAKKPFLSTRAVLMGILLALLANLVLVALTESKPPPEQANLMGAMNFLNSAHVSRPTQEQLAEGALAGMAENLHDPYTQFYPGDKAAQWENELGDAHTPRTLSASPGAWMIDTPKGIGYAALGRFTTHSGKDLRAAIETMKGQGLRGLILDLRGNPGGYLNQATEVVSLFMPQGTPVAKVSGPSVAEKTFVTDAPQATDAPLVILVDEGSASASEVVAGALQEHRRAMVVGVRSFGKGCVQNVVKLPELNGTLKVTTAFYFLPSGRCIHRDGKNDWGVAPSAGGQVPMAAQDRKAWAAILKLPPEENPLAGDAPLSADYLRTNMHDPQLAAAYEALLGKLDSGAWPRVGEDPPPATQDPRWQARDEIRRLETRLKTLRRQLSTPNTAR